MEENVLSKYELKKEACLKLIDDRFPDVNKVLDPNEDLGKFPNRIIEDSDYMSCKLFAFIVDYDFEIVSKIVGSTEGLQLIAQKGLLEISLFAGIKGWKSQD